ncbi:MAG: formate--tetrahydrofolate ligase, partial [Deltaproteobacteria bacterium]|nr:formate--tetrahydrofolate ligase [Deltaproteobacteria bacterium]
ENALLFGVPVVVAVNRFTPDTDKEIELIKKRAKEFGAEEAVESDVWEKGGEGGKELAEAVVRACDKKSDFKFLYPLDIPIKDKIETIATKIYGAKDVSYTPVAEKQIANFTANGFDKLPMCMAKTHLSLSHDPALKGRPTGFTLPISEVRASVGAGKGRPTGFTLPISEVRASVGAGFLYPLCGAMRTMPGLPTRPAGEKVDIDKDGKVVGLF